MSAFLLGAVAVLTLLILVSFYRVVQGPSLFDRLVGLSAISNKAVAIILLLGAGVGRFDMFIDISIAYVLLNLVGSLAAARFLEKPQWTRS